MNPARGKLLIFGGALALAIGVGAMAGAIAQQVGDGRSDEAGHVHGAADAHDHGTADAHAGHAAPAATAAGGAQGITVSDDTLTLALERTRVATGARRSLEFTVRDTDGRPVTDMDVVHERPMHVIVVRRDLTGFQHVHPTAGADGRWRVPLRLDEAGVYRVYADFSHRGVAHVLSADLTADGALRARVLPAPGDVARGDGLTARVIQRHDDGGRLHLRYRVERDGNTVTTLRPWLGAAAHVVMLREGDLAFTHTHAADIEPTRPGELDVTIAPAPRGRHRVFIQFDDGDGVRTLSHTVEVT